VPGLPGDDRIPFVVGGNSGRGIEVWHFNHEGKVAHLSAYGYLKVRSPFHPLQAVQLLLGSPGMTISAGLTRLRFRSNHLGHSATYVPRG